MMIAITSTLIDTVKWFRYEILTQFKIRHLFAHSLIWSRDGTLSNPLTNRYYHLVRVDLGVMAMKGYSVLPRAPGVEPHHQMASRHIRKTYPNSRFILELQLTGLYKRSTTEFWHRPEKGFMGNCRCFLLTRILSKRILTACQLS